MAAGADDSGGHRPQDFDRLGDVAPAGGEPASHHGETGIAHAVVRVDELAAASEEICTIVRRVRTRRCRVVGRSRPGSVRWPRLRGSLQPGVRRRRQGLPGIQVVFREATVQAAHGLAGCGREHRLAYQFVAGRHSAR
ncbi:hypothetical protein ACRAWF_04585 [Streptomyces sp. L7]